MQKAKPMISVYVMPRNLGNDWSNNIIINNYADIILSTLSYIRLQNHQTENKTKQAFSMHMLANTVPSWFLDGRTSTCLPLIYIRSLKC